MFHNISKQESLLAASRRNSSASSASIDCTSSAAQLIPFLVISVPWNSRGFIGNCFILELSSWVIFYAGVGKAQQSDWESQWKREGRVVSNHCISSVTSETLIFALFLCSMDMASALNRVMMQKLIVHVCHSLHYEEKRFSFYSYPVFMPPHQT